MCLILGLIVPLTPIVVSMSTFAVEVGNLKNIDTSTLNLFMDGGLGFVNSRYPPILCSPSSREMGHVPKNIIVKISSVE